MSKTRKYKRYNPGFKRETLKRAGEDGISDKQVCEEEDDYKMRQLP